MSIKFVETDVTELNIDAHISLFRKCFPNSTVFSKNYLEWLYRGNPAGSVIGTDAWIGETLAATYVTIPANILYKGSSVRGLLSLNTATHPDYQGQGLFTKLAQETYSRAKSLGFQIVYGVANNNSVGGFVRKLNFQKVAQLDARISFAPTGPMPGTSPGDVDFVRSWDSKTLAWRAANPANPLSIKKGAGGIVLRGRSSNKLIDAAAFMPNSIIQSAPLEIGHGTAAPLTVGLGLAPSGNYNNVGVCLPEKLKPAPLHLIFRHLTEPNMTITVDRISFSFCDFDAF